MCTDKQGVHWNSKCNTMRPDRQQHDLPVACVIAHQYSSATFVSLRLDPHRKRNAAFLKKCYCFNLFFTFQNSGNLQWNKPYLELSWVEECLYLWGRILSVKLTIPVYISYLLTYSMVQSPS